MGFGGRRFGAGLGLAAALQQTTLAVAIVALPALVALLLHPDWIAPVLVASIFGKALSTGGLTVSRLVGPLALLIIVLSLPAREGPRLPGSGSSSLLRRIRPGHLQSMLWTVNPELLVSPGRHRLCAGLAPRYRSSTCWRSSCSSGATGRLARGRGDLDLLGGSRLVAIGQYAGGYTRAIALSGDANLFAAVQVVALPIEAVLVGQVRSTRKR